jgi:hypothetical protein
LFRAWNTIVTLLGKWKRRRIINRPPFIAIVLNNYTEIVNYNISNGQWPSMNQTTGGIFIEFTQEDFQKWLNADWTTIEDLEEINNESGNIENINSWNIEDIDLEIENEEKLEEIDEDVKYEKNIEKHNQLQSIFINIKNRFQKIFQ